MKSTPKHDPEPPTNPESSNQFLDPFMTSRDHANQWDLSEIWQAPSDSEPDSSDLDLQFPEAER